MDLAKIASSDLLYETDIRHKENPFIAGLGTAVVPGMRYIADTQNNRFMVVNEDGKNIAQAGFWEYKKVDKAQFIKLYLGGVKLFKQLSSAGSKVFEILYYVVMENHDKDRIYLAYDKQFMQQYQISDRHWLRGITELLEKGFIAKTSAKHFYYLNPDYIWNGDRLNFISRIQSAPKCDDQEFNSLIRSTVDEATGEIVLTEVEGSGGTINPKNKYLSNPFILDASSNTVRGVRRVVDKSNNRFMLLNENGDFVAQAGFWQFKQVDKTKFVKLYVNGVKIFKHLTSAGTRVFEIFYIYIQKNQNKDTLYLSFHTIAAEHDISQPTWNRGLNELLEKGFIAKAETLHVFYLNPDYMWNGDRLDLIERYENSEIEIKRKMNHFLEVQYKKMEEGGLIEG